MAQYDVLIVGGGLVGPLAAIALSEAGLSVAVIDRLPLDTRSAAEFDGRAYALSHASFSMLNVLGLWAGLKNNAQAILDIKVSDGRAMDGASPNYAHFDHTELEEGPMGYLVEDRHLRRALLTRLNDLAIEQFNTASVTAWDEGRIDTNDGTLTASLILAADGRNSSIANFAGIKRRGWGYQQTSLVCAINHEKPHMGCAHQFFTPTGPLAILPLTGNRSSIVWTESRSRAEVIQNGKDAGYLEALRPVFGDFLGEISLKGQRFAYPLGLSLAERLIGPRLALIGDAGHGIHPLAGQGFNLGVKDAAALAEVVISARRRGEDIGTADV